MQLAVRSCGFGCGKQQSSLTRIHKGEHKTKRVHISADRTSTYEIKLRCPIPQKAETCTTIPHIHIHYHYLHHTEDALEYPGIQLKFHPGFTQHFGGVEWRHRRRNESRGYAPEYAAKIKRNASRITFLDTPTSLIKVLKNVSSYLNLNERTSVLIKWERSSRSTHWFPKLKHVDRRYALRQKK